MNDSWFFTENFCELPENFFDDAIKELELPVENLEHNDSVGDWEEKFKHLELPTTTVLASIPSSFHGGSSYRTLDVNESLLIADNKSLQPKEDSSEAKYLHLSRTSSPVSVLDSSSSSSSSSVEIPIPRKRPRSKRPRSRRQTFSFISVLNTYNRYQHLGPLDSEPNVEAMLLNSAVRKQTKKRNPKQISSNQEPTEIRKCTHCEVTETPQWREGPMGPKTLCNACGVRYRSGRLLPEYRPAASPTFIPSLHSNSHRKVLEMRKQTKGSAHVGNYT